ncbi:hypothetical protein R2Q81_12575 [Microbacterium aquimaris]|uniref:hypothetical protein n=1 Tax=Microbacterium aquimaris TaxID=459816 RepID=UPI002AD33160|nr:hypothetical protein [Microbacterium aquimaris]MDZ8276776.1 hypothetical protein [Microbacterium aquimaris]
MTKTTFWTILGVIAAVVIAWILVEFVFTAIVFLFKLVIVAIVALIVFFLLRAAFSRSS